MKFTPLFLTFLLGLSSVNARLGDTPSNDSDIAAPEHRHLLETVENPIIGQYIVVLTPVDDINSAISTIVNALPRVSVIHTYEFAMKGVALAGVTAVDLSLLSALPIVDLIVQDGTISLDSTTQTSPPWGLDRIDQVNAPPYDDQYVYSCTGSGSWVYVLDTGIRPSHNDFGNRAVCGPSFVNSENDCLDGNGHGTHCAGTVAGTTFGVAKDATVVGVKVLSSGGSGSISGVIAGVDYVAQEKTNNPNRAVIGSMSLGGGTSSGLDRAVRGAVDIGVVMIVAAGNDNRNACNYSPAREPSAITVGATTSQDARAGYSNFGSCVDIFAPGSGITSAWHTSDTATNTISGTSMATPHVAGVAALYLQAGSTASQMLADGIPNTINSVGSGSPNLMSYTGSITCDGGSNPGPSPTPAPGPSPTAPPCLGSGSSCGSDGECCSGECGCTLLGCLFGGSTCD